MVRKCVSPVTEGRHPARNTGQVPSANRELVDEVYRRTNARDLRVAELLHPQVEWYWPEETVEKSQYEGRQEVTRGFSTWNRAWDEFQMDPEEIIEDGDDLLVVARYSGTGAESGVPIEAAVAHLIRVKDGRVYRWWMFGDAEKARSRFLAGDRPPSGE